MSALKYWVWLSVTRGLGGVKIAQLIDYFGAPENVYSASKKDLKEAAPLTPRDLDELQNKSFDHTNRILEQCDKLGVQIVTMADAKYPDRLKAIHAAPALLYVKGHMPDFDEEVALCMVGSRKATPYGLINAEKLSFELASSGALILSGMAVGIDTASHKGALKAGSPTVAILGCGLDICYPPQNRDLMENIASIGALISEYPPGMQALGGNFPARNRILSGLSLGTIVIEAPLTSGSLITANYALEQGRDVFAIPGNIDAAVSQGTNSLIKQGAKLVTCAADVLEEYTALYPHKLHLIYNRSDFDAPPFNNPGTDVHTPEAVQPVLEYKEKREIPLEGLNDKEKKIIAVLKDNDTVHIDQLITLTGLKTQEILSTLTILQLKKIIKQLPGKYFTFEQEK
ncbi:MAG: DNA-processing protein DprA [Clostridiales bacterium]|nr:DNA-processing protein DprA [Clostridiales bacterium]